MKLSPVTVKSWGCPIKPINLGDPFGRGKVSLPCFALAKTGEETSPLRISGKRHDAGASAYNGNEVMLQNFISIKAIPVFG